MNFILRLCVVCFLVAGLTMEASVVRAAEGLNNTSVTYLFQARAGVSAADTSGEKTDTTVNMAPVDTQRVDAEAYLKNGISPERASTYPTASLQQVLKGHVAGLYVQEPSGEPGSQMSMFIRGTAIPYTSHKDIYNAQPTVIVDGVPLIMDHPFAFDIQLYDYNRIGTATNLLAAIDPNNIASITVLKDFADAAMYGPHAANGGVILVKTKAPVIGGRKISVNTYFGVAQKPHVYTTNARFEDKFRQPYYDRYAGLNEVLNYPLYLRDSTNSAYYGPSDWTDLYYKNKLIRGISASLSSGTERANFRFAAGNEQTKNPGDNTKLDRYNAMFEINMLPVSWLTISAMINATRLERSRNNYLRDRFADVQYLPDLINPIAPNKAEYAKLLHQLDKSFDNNKTNVITGYFDLNFKFSDAWNFVSMLGFNYNEGLRDIFYPSTLMETVNYVSNYFGYNQRLTFNNTLRWHHNFDNVHDISIEAGQIFEADFNRYNYSYVYNGPNDLIKLNILYSDPNASNYLSSKAFPRELSHMFLDKQRHRLLSFYGRAHYDYAGKADLSVLVRSDGSSGAQPDNWWFVSPTVAAGWNLKNTLLQDNAGVSGMKLHVSWGRVGRLMTDDRFGEGPQYLSDMSFNNEPVKFSYDAFPGLSRPYSSGYVGYDIKWPYTTQTDVGLDMSFMDHKINLALDVYNKVDHNMLFAVPGATEYGYNGVYRNGLKVRNRGVDLDFRAMVLPEKSSLQWVPFFNLNYNENELLALPDGLTELIIGTGVAARKLKVGHAIDQYWLLKNQGIYNKESEIPVNPNTGAKMTYKGTPLNPGDPIWADENGDHIIDDKDKVMTGHYLPRISGGFGSDFIYHHFTLSLSFYYVTGTRILNQDIANHLDFANREGKISMDAIKEITFWSKSADYADYPMYNPWSKVEPYRTDQDLFLENGSFLKLRQASLEYDLTATKWWNKKSFIQGLKVYATASNLFTITPYTGRDPELVYFNGVDNGYGLPIPKTYTIGCKIDF